jgi:ribonuclease HII
MPRKSKTLVTGIDEAGRGALIGPMIVTGLTVEKWVVDELKSAGVKDSKVLTPKSRQRLYETIKEIVQEKSGVSSIMPIAIPSCEIDQMRANKINLNLIEVRTMSRIIDTVGGKEIYVDALTSRPQRFKKHLRNHLGKDKRRVKIIAENNADKKYPIVSAASIIAKVERDQAIEELKEQVGVDFGIGYPSDDRTVDYVESLIKRRKKLPPYVRRSWITTQMLQEKNWQRKIKDFLGF